jgi:hypothetical protein
MNGWNRLFIVIAICWAIVAPFLLMADTNGPVDRIFEMCSSRSYRQYGASDSTVRLDMEKYKAEQDVCLNNYTRDYLDLRKLLSALIGIGGSSRELTLVA